MIIDAHAHIFPDKIASKAIAGLEQQYGVNACGEATVAGICTSMQAGHVDASVLLSVATTTAQVESINNWVAEISTDAPNFIGLGAMHPDYPEPNGEIRRMREMGIKGIKLHSEFQHFYPDEERMYPIYEALSDDMVLVFHAGDEVIPVRHVHTTPDRVASVLDSFPRLKIVAAHLGGHRCWDEVERHLLGRDLYLDTAYVFPIPGHEHITVKRIINIMETHGYDRILFGTDYPFRDQGSEVTNIQGLDIDDRHKALILGENAAALFKIDTNGT
jgi:predicted TIM-barrel fold metal-dependent hydrolase